MMPAAIMGRPELEANKELKKFTKRIDLKNYAPLTVYLAPETIAKLRKQAERLSQERGNKMTVSDVMRELLTKHL